jgi:hypothetical protein
MNGWQPIETAPRDGTPILLGRFVKKCKYGRANIQRVDWWRRPEDKQTYVGFGQFSSYWPPTHWMHLPPPPEAAP